MLAGLYCIKLPGALILLFKALCRACYSVIGIQVKILKTIILGEGGVGWERQEGLIRERRIGLWLTGLP